MALSIVPNMEWDYTRVVSPLVSTGTVTGTTQSLVSGASLAADGLVVESAYDRGEVAVPTAAKLARPFTIVCLAKVSYGAGSTPCSLWALNLASNRFGVMVNPQKTGVNPGLSVANVQGGYGAFAEEVTSGDELVTVAIFEDGQKRLYVNGILLTSETTSFTAPDYTGAILYVGDENGGDSNSRIAYWGQYDGILSGGDIAALGADYVTAYSALYPTSSSAAFGGINVGLIY